MSISILKNCDFICTKNGIFLQVYFQENLMITCVIIVLYSICKYPSLSVHRYLKGSLTGESLCNHKILGTTLTCHKLIMSTLRSSPRCAFVLASRWSFELNYKELGLPALAMHLEKWHRYKHATYAHMERQTWRLT